MSGRPHEPLRNAELYLVHRAMVGSVFVFKLGENWRDSHFRAGNASYQGKETLFVQEYVPVVGLVQKRKQTGGSSAKAAAGKTVGQFFKRGT